MRSIELFTGGGGLAIGTAMAGFEHVAVVERDRDSCETLRLNQRRGFPLFSSSPIMQIDVREVDYDALSKIEMIAGGVPCQPFSVGGKHRAHEDSRDMFPEFAKAVASLRPKAFLVENVKGLLRAAFADYFAYVILRLSHPLVTMKKGQTWEEHRKDLEKIQMSAQSTGLDYDVAFQLVNAANYGVPQRRERVFIVGFRSDLGVDWSFPEETHSKESLMRQQFATGEYWERHKIPEKHRPTIDKSVLTRIQSRSLFGTDPLPWRTVRDAISDLPKLELGQTDPIDPNHFLNAGARSYKGHTGSPWDEPAKTLKAGDHGVPGGENTLNMGNGQVRYFSVRECARIQTFPDSYWFSGAWTERMRQIGNAVPVLLARTMAVNIRTKLEEAASPWSDIGCPTDSPRRFDSRLADVSQNRSCSSPAPAY